jgi:hypothetical protein
LKRARAVNAHGYAVHCELNPSVRRDGVLTPGTGDLGAACGTKKCVSCEIVVAGVADAVVGIVAEQGGVAESLVSVMSRSLPRLVVISMSERSGESFGERALASSSSASRLESSIGGVERASRTSPRVLRIDDRRETVVAVVTALSRRCRLRHLHVCSAQKSLRRTARMARVTNRSTTHQTARTRDHRTAITRQRTGSASSTDDPTPNDGRTGADVVLLIGDVGLGKVREPNGVPVAKHAAELTLCRTDATRHDQRRVAKVDEADLAAVADPPSPAQSDGESRLAAPRNSRTAGCGHAIHCVTRSQLQAIVTVASIRRLVVHTLGRADGRTD